MVSLVAVLALTTWSCAGYVADTSVAPGDRVRVTAPSLGLKKEVGAVAALETSTLIVNSDERADALDVPLADVTKLEVYRGQKSQAGKGALIGGLVVAPIGVFTGILLHEYGERMCDSNCSESSGSAGGAAVLGAALFGTVGAGLGALMGSAFRADRWEAVHLDEIA